MPSSCAFFSFPPAASPATTANVLEDTELEVFAPFSLAKASAWARGIVFNSPVNTKVLPLKIPPSLRRGVFIGSTPLSLNLSSSFFISSSAKKSYMLLAITGPISSILSNSGKEAWYMPDA